MQQRVMVVERIRQLLTETMADRSGEELVRLLPVLHPEMKEIHYVQKDDTIRFQTEEEGCVMCGSSAEYVWRPPGKDHLLCRICGAVWKVEEDGP